LDGDKATGKTPNLKETPRKRPFSAKQLYAKLRSISRTANSVPRPTYRLENEWISNSLVRERIDFFVNVSPEIAILDVPFLVIVWDLQHRLQPFFPEVGSGDEWQRRENFFSQVLKRAAYVVTAEDTAKKEVQMFYGIPDERIRILPHPTPRFALEDGAQDTSMLAQFRLPPNYIFYPAQFWSHKNHVRILRAFCTSNRSTICACPLSSPVPIKGTKVISGNWCKRCSWTIRYFFSATSRVRLCGPCIKTLSSFVIRVFSGPLNLPPLEAFALGCPVIAADIPGAKQELGDAAMLVNPANEFEIAEALKSVRSDSAKRESLIARGKERARRFTGSDFANGLFDLLDEFQPIRRCWSADSQFSVGS